MLANPRANARGLMDYCRNIIVAVIKIYNPASVLGFWKKRRNSSWKIALVCLATDIQVYKGMNDQHQIIKKTRVIIFSLNEVSTAGYYHNTKLLKEIKIPWNQLACDNDSSCSKTCAS